VNCSAGPHALSKNGLHVSRDEPGIGICEVSAVRVFIGVVERSSTPLGLLGAGADLAVLARFGLVACMVGIGFVSIIETFPATFPPNQ
jgi:hypothetical protein